MKKEEYVKVEKHQCKSTAAMIVPTRWREAKGINSLITKGCSLEINGLGTQIHTALSVLEASLTFLCLIIEKHFGSFVLTHTEKKAIGWFMPMATIF